jgi:transcriptional regulator with XRE-family HTH domain
MSLKSEKQQPVGQGWATNCVEIGGPFETEEERAGRLHRFPGGPLVGWLFDEARRRDEQIVELATALGVTTGFLAQLQNGQRDASHISADLAAACAKYLGVPPIVVKLVSGNIAMSDFLCPSESEEVTVDRALQQVVGDPRLRRSVPVDLLSLPLNAKKAIVFLFQEYSSVDCLSAQRLPNLVHWMQRAAMVHDEAEYLAQTGQRGTTSL